jgi:hypothetical protein
MAQVIPFLRLGVKIVGFLLKEQPGFLLEEQAWPGQILNPLCQLAIKRPESFRTVSRSFTVSD